jgi:N-acetyl-gamma-glutamyl-phosphate reductase common form
MTRSLDVGVLGAGGIAGGEVCRLLLGHPAVGTVTPAARTTGPLERAHPNLAGCALETVTPEALHARAGEFDVLFTCTPSGEAMGVVGAHHARGTRIVDLGPDFRFADAAEFKRVYGEEHASPDLLAEAVYGATELYRDEVARARLVANPGCYAITAELALAPLLREGLLDPQAPISIHAVNGTTGAGSTPKADLMHARVTASMLAYSLEGHRHGPELERIVEEIGGRPLTVDFNTAHGDFARGIHLQANVRLSRDLGRDALLELYTGAYGRGHEGEYFVQVNTLPKAGKLNAKQYELYPRLNEVVGSNFCHLGIDHDDERGIVKIVAVTDNLVKGAAGGAIQNMNVMLGLEETLGLRAYAL